MANDKSVLYLVDVFLPPTQTFVYNAIVGVQDYRKMILTNERINENLFPFEEQNIIKFPYYIAKDRDYHADRVKIKAFNTAKKIIHPFLRPWLKKHFTNLVDQHNIKIMHSHFGPNGDGFIKIKKDANVKLITEFHGHDTIPILRKEPKFSDRLFEEGDLMLAEGNAMKKIFTNHGYPAEKFAIHHLSIDLEKFPYKKRILSKGEKIKVLFVGRFVEKKGIDYLVRAFKKVLENRKDIELILIGDGSEMPKIKKLVEDLALKENVHLKGFITPDKINAEMEKAHIFAHPSVTAQDGDTEGGTPTVILEAEAAGMPILATFHADIPEQVIDKKSGLLAPERDEETLAKNLLWLIDHPEEWSKMGREGRLHIEKEYNHLIQGQRLAKIYDSLLS